jgi:Na+/H+ antiporter NhaD/arsenite permease-like protein
MSEAQGHPISFRTYLRYGVPATILTMLIGTLDVWLRYIIFR